MGEIILPRRKFLVGSLAALFVAPAIISSGVLMPVKSFAQEIDVLNDLSDYHAQYADFKKRFLEEYRKSPDAEAAKKFNVGAFAGKWTGSNSRMYQTHEQLHSRRWITEFD